MSAVAKIFTEACPFRGANAFVLQKVMIRNI